jgi:hypothetical protein
MKTFLTKKHAVLLAAALLAASAGTASARITGDASSTNVQAATGGAGYAGPHEVPENGGAADLVQPGSLPN